MTREEYLAYHKAACEKMHAITTAKNNDYTGSSDDPFANFKIVEVYGVVNAEEGFFTRMSDKFSRLASFIKKGVLYVKDESIEDTLLDLANYCILLAAYLKDKKLKQDRADHGVYS